LLCAPSSAIRWLPCDLRPTVLKTGGLGTLIPKNVSLVDGLLEEENARTESYVDAHRRPGSRLEWTGERRAPPPGCCPLAELRASAAFCKRAPGPLCLQRGRGQPRPAGPDWFGPGGVPNWSATAEPWLKILANLLKMPSATAEGSAVGPTGSQPGQPERQPASRSVSRLDGGPAISLKEREATLNWGQSAGAHSEGSRERGGLALARQWPAA